MVLMRPFFSSDCRIECNDPSGTFAASARTAAFASTCLFASILARSAPSTALWRALSPVMAQLVRHAVVSRPRLSHLRAEEKCNAGVGFRITIFDGRSRGDSSKSWHCQRAFCLWRRAQHSRRRLRFKEMGRLSRKRALTIEELPNLFTVVSPYERGKPWLERVVRGGE